MQSQYRASRGKNDARSTIYIIRCNQQSNRDDSWAMISQAKLTQLIFADVCLDNLIIEPHVRDRHAVLRQCSGLVWADRWRRAESFDRLKILH